MINGVPTRVHGDWLETFKSEWLEWRQTIRSTWQFFKSELQCPNICQACSNMLPFCSCCVCIYPSQTNSTNINFEMFHMVCLNKGHPHIQWSIIIFTLRIAMIVDIVGKTYELHPTSRLKQSHYLVFCPPQINIKRKKKTSGHQSPNPSWHGIQLCHLGRFPLAN